MYGQCTGNVRALCDRGEGVVLLCHSARSIAARHSSAACTVASHTLPENPTDGHGAVDNFPTGPRPCTLSDRRVIVPDRNCDETATRIDVCTGGPWRLASPPHRRKTSWASRIAIRRAITVDQEKREPRSALTVSDFGCASKARLAWLLRVWPQN